MSEWIIEYDNDTGPNDEGFSEWWTVSKGDISYRTNSEFDAQMLLAILSAAIPEAQKVESVAHYAGRRLTPEGTLEFWGWLKPNTPPIPEGTLLYAAPPTPPEREAWIARAMELVRGIEYAASVYEVQHDKYALGALRESRASLESHLRTVPELEGWQDIATAPKDGTPYIAGNDSDMPWVQNQPPGLAPGRWIRTSSGWRGASNPRKTTRWAPIPPAREPS